MTESRFRKNIGLSAGVVAFLITVFFDSPFADLSPAGWRAMGMAAMMAVWWIAEAVPIPVTSFLPLIIAPIAGLASMSEVASAYSHPLIFLFMGGFILSIAIERTGLHLRIARTVVASVGSSARMQIGSMMLVTAFLSMWISNTATAVMMLPIAVSVSNLIEGSSDEGDGRFAPMLLLGIAYSASIGGMATIIGTPPNALLVAYLHSTYNIHIGFGQWMLFGVPFSFTMLLATWLILTRKGFGAMNTLASSKLIRQQLKEMGPMSRGEKSTLTVFACAALCWIFRSQLVKQTGVAISDTGIAITAALVLFLLPYGDGSGKRLLDWKHMERLPWGVLLLFGGGLALAATMQSTGLAEFVGLSFSSLRGMDILWVALAVGGAIVFLTEITSNTATTAGLLPLMGPVALALGESPATLAITAAIAASCAFMMPVATPPNAIVFASGRLKISQMARTGILLNFVSMVTIAVCVKWLLPLVF